MLMFALDDDEDRWINLDLATSIDARGEADAGPPGGGLTIRMLGGGTHRARGDRAEALRRVLRAHDAERGIGAGSVAFAPPWGVLGDDGRGLDDPAARPEVGGGGGGDVLGDLEEAGSPVGGADVATSAAADVLGTPRAVDGRDPSTGVE